MAWLKNLTYSRNVAWLLLWPLLVTGVLVFRATGVTPWLSYWSMRRLYCITRGRSNQWLARVLGCAPGFENRVDGLLRRAADTMDTDTFTQGVERDGFAVLGVLLTDAECDQLIEFAHRTPARLIPSPGNPVEALFDAQRPLAFKYDLPEPTLIEHPVIQKVIADASLRELARRYLRCEPVNDLVAMWWSSAMPGPASSEAAQLYHFDMDRPQFLKIFFYLTDVTAQSGPHCYIRGSHRDRPDALWRDGRYENHAILDHYGGCEVEITGRRGTAIAVDTSGFHKGKPLSGSHRLVLQIEYTSALFGQSYQRLTVPDNRFWTEQLRLHPHYYSRFSLKGSATAPDRTSR